MSIFDEIYEADKKSEYFLFQKLASSFARSVASVLKYKKINQKVLAEKLNVSEANISKIMRGDTNVTLLTIAKIANTLDCDIQDITMFDNKYIYSNTETLKANKLTWENNTSWMSCFQCPNIKNRPVFVINKQNNEIRG